MRQRAGARSCALAAFGRHGSRIADLTLEVRGHAVILGANDVGKSSLLRVLNLLRGSSTGALYQQLTWPTCATRGAS